MNTITCSRCGLQSNPFRTWPFRCSCGLQTNADGSTQQIGAGHQWCQHRTAITRHVKCRVCGNRDTLVPVFGCEIHGECTVRKTGVRPAIKSCLTCADHTEREPERAGVLRAMMAIVWLVACWLHPR